MVFSFRQKLDVVVLASKDIIALAWGWSPSKHVVIIIIVVIIKNFLEFYSLNTMMVYVQVK